MGPDARRGETTWRSQKGLLTAILTSLILLLAAFAVLIHDNQSAARGSLDERFLNRATLTAGFTGGYVREMAARERSQAERLLAAPDVDRATFEQVVQSFGFEAAVLLDGRGRALHVWPRRPELVGRDFASQYPHLATALGGSVGISPIVPAAGDGTPVAAVATPFDADDGRRVLSGAFSPATTPLGAYVANVISVSNGHGYLVDQAGNLVSGQAGETEVPAELRLLPAGIVQLDTLEGRTTVATVPIEGLPWQVVLAVPTAAWYEPVNEVRWAPWALLAALAVGGVLVVVLVMGLGRARGDAAQTARTDPLTGLPNRRAIDEMLLRAAAHAKRHGDPLSVLMLDVDHFKTVNDIHGHATGDLVLQKVAEVLGEVGRGEDMAGRWGGEEFLVVLQATGVEGAIVAAERLRAAVGRAEVPAGRATVRVTASIGVAVLAGGSTPEVLVRAADNALYRAKANGRDAVEVARVLGPEPLDLAGDRAPHVTPRMG